MSSHSQQSKTESVNNIREHSLSERKRAQNIVYWQARKTLSGLTKDYASDLLPAKCKQVKSVYYCQKGWAFKEVENDQLR